MKYFVFALCMVLGNCLLSQENYTLIKDAKAIEQKILAASLNTQSIACDFIQTKQLEYLSMAIESSGKFWFADGNKLRWEYTHPFKYIIAINNGVFIIKDDDKITSFDTKSNKAFKELNDILMSTVDGSLMKSGKFSFTIKENKNSYLVELTPQSEEMGKILSNIHLYFAKTDLSVFKVKMIETAQDYTIINFNNRKINSTIDPSIFNLK